MTRTCKNHQKANSQRSNGRKEAPKKKSAVRKINFRGIIYFVEAKKGKVFVRVNSTAHGQKLLAGVFNPATKSWQNESIAVALPKDVRVEVERLYAVA